MKLNEVIFVDSLPSIDLHGYDREYARVKINEFINDNIKMKNEIIAIIHGVGSGILKSETIKTLSYNKHVLEHKLFYNNVGITIAKLKLDK